MGPNEQSIEDILASIRRVIVAEPAPAPGMDHAAEDAPAPAEEDDVLELSRPLPPVSDLPAAAASQAPSAPPAAPGPALVAPQTADASRLALAALSQLRLSGGDPADDTLAGLVREMLRPMLKVWLDAELPAIVERMVVHEIARLTPRD